MDIRFNEKVDKYRVGSLKKGDWRKLHTNRTIGHLADDREQELKAKTYQIPTVKAYASAEADNEVYSDFEDDNGHPTALAPGDVPIASDSERSDNSSQASKASNGSRHSGSSSETDSNKPSMPKKTIPPKSSASSKHTSP
ncbi:hypothetical protein PHYBOEH_008437 [Phytophthora boehmeriae]|uniref:Uncharacterized protein n=1 Tax=Phytophthora boehmeriae TaxID=109152 RepID=A0A8T1W2Z6_9STRA|nr:hypothetical protein PHYBOEH_008437 [Phytophthora boehmeriae]